jgi:hypothetical protein
MSLGACWDCPISIWALLLHFLILALLAGTGAWIYWSGLERIRGCGLFVVCVMLLWGALFARAVSRWGIRKGDSIVDVMNRPAMYATLIAVETALVFVVLGIRRFRVSRRQQ